MIGNHDRASLPRTPGSRSLAWALSSFHIACLSRHCDKTKARGPRGLTASFTPPSLTAHTQLREVTWSRRNLVSPSSHCGPTSVRRGPQRPLGRRKGNGVLLSLSKDTDAGDNSSAVPPPAQASSPTHSISGIAVLCDLARTLDLSEYRCRERG